MLQLLLLIPLLLVACSSPAQEMSTDAGRPINTHCPRSGKPVVDDSWTEYRGVVVGFCNTHCRDDFAANVEERPEDRAFFDAILAGR